MSISTTLALTARTACAANPSLNCPCRTLPRHLVTQHQLLSLALTITLRLTLTLSLSLSKAGAVLLCDLDEQEMVPLALGEA